MDGGVGTGAAKPVRHSAHPRDQVGQRRVDGEQVQITHRSVLHKWLGGDHGAL